MPRFSQGPRFFFRVALAAALLCGVVSSSGCREMAGKKKNKSPHAKDEDKKSESKDAKPGAASQDKDSKKAESKSDAAAK